MPVRSTALSIFFVLQACVHAGAQPLASFTIASGSYCSPAVVNFTNASTATPPFTFTWSVNGVIVDSNSADLTYLFDTCGVYQVILTITDSAGLTASDSQWVAIGCQPVAAFQLSANHLCVSDSVTIYDLSQGIDTLSTMMLVFFNAMESDTVWNFPATIGFTHAGTVQMVFTVQTVYGCADTAAQTLHVYPLPIVHASADFHLCLGDSATLSASGAQQYVWSPSEYVSDANVSHPICFPPTTTLYQVIGIDTNGCQGIDSVAVIVTPPPPVSAGPDTSVCFGSSLTLQGTSAQHYLWSPGQVLSDSTSAMPVFWANATTTFILLGTDSFGCSATDSIIVHVISAPDLIVSNDTTVCQGSSVLLSAASADNYLWKPSESLSSSSIAQPVATPLQTTTYTLTAIVNGCSFHDSVKITVLLPPSVQIVPANATICKGDTLLLAAQGAAFYYWQPPWHLSDPYVAQPLCWPSSSITYVVVGTDLNGCSASDSISVVVNPRPSVLIFADPQICLGDSIPMYAVGGVFYEWAPTTGLSHPNNYATLASPAYTTTYTVTCTNAYGCSDTASHTIQVHPRPVATASEDQWVCPYEPVPLFADGGVYYSWQPTIGLSNAAISNPVASVGSSIVYTVTVTNSFSCSDTETVRLFVYPPLQAQAGHDTTICVGGYAQLHASGGLTYEWMPASSLNNAFIADPIASPTQTTIYKVVVQDQCMADTLKVFVVVQPPPFVEAGSNATTIAGIPVTLTATAAQGTYQWNPAAPLSCSSCLSTQALVYETTTFVITVTDSIGCTASDTLSVLVHCHEQIVFVPNVFTPNGDGINDRLYVRAEGISDLMFFRLFDRWGKKLFETSSLSVGWDGTFNGKPAPAGTYLYEWQVRCRTGEVIHRFGNVTLLR